MKREFFVIPKAKFDEFKEALEQSADREIVHAEVDNDGIVVAIRGQER